MPAALASAADGAGAVYVLDFERGTQELVAAQTDCPKRLRHYSFGEHDKADRGLFFACVTPGPPNRVDETFNWGEFYDLKTRTRLHTASMMPVTHFEDGTLVWQSAGTRRAESAGPNADFFVW